MSEYVNIKHDRINNKIATSQTRLLRDAPIEPLRELPRDEYPPEHISTLAGQYPLLALAAGAMAGVALGALLPRAFGRTFSRRAVTILTIAGELGLAASRNARDAAQQAGRQGAVRLGQAGDSLAEGRSGLRQRAGRIADKARNTSLDAAREMIKLAARVPR